MASRVQSFGLVAGVFALLCLPLILSHDTGGYASDETEFHLPAIRQIRAHWPRLDLTRDSLSATAPGYQYALATLSLVTGAEPLPLRLATWSVSLALLWVLWRLFPAGQSTLAVIALLPLACSNFFVKSASWVVTDNAALLGMASTLALVLTGRGRGTIWAAGCLGGLTTFIRQLYAWIAVPIGLRALRDMAADRGHPARSLKLLAALLPLGVVAILVWQWGGLVPPIWRNINSLEGKVGTASLSYILAVFFLLGSCYYAALTADEWKTEFLSRWALLGALAGLVCVLAGPTDYDVSAGRWGGYLWWCAARLPVIGGRSVFFLVLTPLGGLLLGVMAHRLIRRAGGEAGWLWLCSYGCWAGAFLPSRLVFHRYFEPATLVFLTLWVVLLMRAPEPDHRARPWFLRGLAGAQLLLTFATAYHPLFNRMLASAK